MQLSSLLVCFFLHAEDGIRDGHVTGLQTCALPVSRRSLMASTGVLPLLLAGCGADPRVSEDPQELAMWYRSEERRVGKECRCWRGRAQLRNTGGVGAS